MSQSLLCSAAEAAIVVVFLCCIDPVGKGAFCPNDYPAEHMSKPLPRGPFVSKF